MESPQGAGEKRISEPHEKAWLSDSVHAFGAEPQRLHEQNLDKAIDNSLCFGALRDGELVEDFWPR